MTQGDIVRRKKEKAKLLAWSFKGDSRQNIILFETDYLSILFLSYQQNAQSLNIIKKILKNRILNLRYY